MNCFQLRNASFLEQEYSATQILLPYRGSRAMRHARPVTSPVDQGSSKSMEHCPPVRQVLVRRRRTAWTRLSSETSLGLVRLSAASNGEHLTATTCSPQALRHLDTGLQSAKIARSSHEPPVRSVEQQPDMHVISWPDDQHSFVPDQDGHPVYCRDSKLTRQSCMAILTSADESGLRHRRLGTETLPFGCPDPGCHGPWVTRVQWGGAVLALGRAQPPDPEAFLRPRMCRSHCCVQRTFIEFLKQKVEPGMPTSGYTLTERLNRIPVLTTRHKVWGAVLAGLLIFEMADLNAFAYVAPTLRQQWGLSVDAVALISASAFLGMSLGAVIGGILADRFGRKRLLVWGTVFYSGLSILSATSSGPVQLAAYRFFIGAGLYAVTVAALTYVAEMFPRNHRGKVQSLLLAVALLGIPLMSWVSRWVVPMGANGWRWVFVAGGSGLVVAVVASRLLPESVRWLEQHAGAVLNNQSEDIVADIERRSVRITGTDLPVPVTTPAVPVGTASDLVRSGYLKRAVVMSVTLAFATSAFYGYNSWMPVLLTEHGFSTDSSLTYTSILAVAACPGALLAFLFIERVERRTAIMVIYLLTAILLVVFGTTESDVIFASSGVIISLLLYCNTAVMYTYMPEIFPTHLRALGTGIPNSVGRLATVVCMFAVAAILSQMGFTSVFVFLATAAALAALVIGIFGERTRGRTLEDISAINGGSTDPSTRTQTVPAQEVAN